MDAAAAARMQLQLQRGCSCTQTPVPELVSSLYLTRTRTHVTALQVLAAPLLQEAPGATSCMDPQRRTVVNALGCCEEVG